MNGGPVKTGLRTVIVYDTVIGVPPMRWLHAWSLQASNWTVPEYVPALSPPAADNLATACVSEIKTSIVGDRPVPCTIAPANRPSGGSPVQVNTMFCDAGVSP